MPASPSPSTSALRDGAHRLPALLLAALLTCAGCGRQAAEAPPQAPEAPAAPAPEATPAAPAFDIAQLPLSSRPLGAFPYFDLPAGYRHVRGRQQTEDAGRFPFWTGDRFEWVEGRVWRTAVIAAEGVRYEEFGLIKNLERLIADAGGVQVAAGALPAPAREALLADAARSVREGLGDIGNAPIVTWAIRRADRNLWLHLCSGRNGAALVVAEAAPFVATARLLPSAELRQQLDTDGRVAVYIAFASGQAQLPGDAQPQLAQVEALLEDDPGLQLSIEGHTDGRGDRARNRLLSQARAEAVRRALTDAGIDPARLQAQGHGHDRPVADDADEAGRALNRRVELVRQ